MWWGDSQRATEGRDDGHELDIVDGWQLHGARFLSRLL